MLSIKNLTKTYKGGVTAVDDLSLSIAPGDIYGFIGHNGAGKTTTIKCCAGIIGFDKGEISVMGHDVKKEPLVCKSLMAYVPDNPDLYEYLTGIQYVNFICDVFGVGGKDRERRIGEYGDAFEITRALGDLISSYSHGMKQKLALLAALCHEPKLLILDEPFVGLDPSAAVTVKGIMHGICEGGGAIFFSTHVLDVAEKLCNKIAIIKEGRLVVSGETEKLTGGKSLEEVFMEVASRD